MARRVDIDTDDFEQLVACIRYAIEKTKDTDSKLAGFLEEELKEVIEHVDNEQGGSEIAQEIDVVLNFIGGKSGK